MNRKVKVLPKKHEFQLRSLHWTITEASVMKCQIAWYSVSIVLYAWYMYWVAYEILIWQKPIAQVNLANYVGSVVSIALVWAGTRMWKTNRTFKPTKQLKPQKPKPQKTVSGKFSCANHRGFLNQREKSSEIPDECLTCKKLIRCFSSTKK